MFVRGSRENWVHARRVHLDVPCALSKAELKQVKKISSALASFQCGQGVPFALCQREDFTFSDVTHYMRSEDLSGNLIKKKKGAHLYREVMLPHLAVRLRGVKLIRQRKAEGSGTRSTFEAGSSSRSVPEFTSFRTSFDYPGLFADERVRAKATQLLLTKPGDWIREELTKALSAAAYLSNAALGMQSCNDTLRSQQEYDRLDDKYQAVCKEVWSMRKTLQRNKKLEEKAAEHEKAMVAKNKECAAHRLEISNLRQECDSLRESESRLTAALKEIEDLKTQLSAEVGNAMVSESKIQKLQVELSESASERKDLNDRFSQSMEKSRKIKEDLDASSEKVKDLEFEVDGQSDQLQDLNFFGPHVFPSLSANFITDIMTWLEEHPEVQLEHKEALDKIKSDVRDVRKEED